MNHFKFILVSLMLLLAGCGAGTSLTNSAQTASSFESIQANRFEDVNQEITESAALGAATVDDLEYKLGPADVIDITVFQVEELNTQVRVNGRGQVILPLLGMAINR